MANISTIKVGSTSYGITPASHASTATTYGAATASNYGHVKLSDNYTSSAGAAASGIGASSAAVYNAYNTLNSKIGKIKYSGTITISNNNTAYQLPVNLSSLHLVHLNYYNALWGGIYAYYPNEGNSTSATIAQISLYGGYNAIGTKNVSVKTSGLYITFLINHSSYIGHTLHYEII